MAPADRPDSSITEEMDRLGPTPWWKSLAMAFAAVAAVTVVMLAFLWPTVTSTPRDLELDVVGGEQAQTLVDEALDAVEEKTDARASTPTAVATRAEAEERIRAMESYGAVIVDEAGNVEVLTATGASASAAQMLQSVAAQIGQANAQAAGVSRGELAQSAAQLGAEAAAKGAAAQTLAGVLDQMGGAAAAVEDAAVPTLTVTDLAPTRTPTATAPASPSRACR